ncbi:hypothetical protein ANTQUA_LOCUS929 [Anthophora quadrimaculata]
MHSHESVVHSRSRGTDRAIARCIIVDWFFSRVENNALYRARETEQQTFAESANPIPLCVLHFKDLA